MNTQRFIITVIMINLLLSFAIEIWQNDLTTTTAVDRVFSDFVNTNVQEHNELESTEGVWGGIRAQAEKLQETTAGNIVMYSVWILKILIKAVIPVPWGITDATDVISKAVLMIVWAVRVLIGTLAGLEIYLLIKNKKAT